LCPTPPHTPLSLSTDYTALLLRRQNPTQKSVANYKEKVLLWNIFWEILDTVYGLKATKDSYSVNL
jgi:hypothetical protein